MSKTLNKLFVLAITLRLAGAQGAEGPAVFLGANSCASSSCHGGGGTNQNQFLVWSLKDFHSRRPVATLGTARSLQIAQALQSKNPAADARCTTCHAPLSEVPDQRRGAGFQVSEGVSCESCHGPAENWLRSHTRTDWTRAERTAAGLRDLANPYVRANTCVACHQVVATPLLQAGHPELRFELDGQCVAEPKHWREKETANRAQSWLVGQAVALREMSWQLANESPPDARLQARWRGLLGLLQKLDGLDPALPGLGKVPTAGSPEIWHQTQLAADTLARACATLAWTDDLSLKALTRLAGTAGDFSPAAESGEVPARRAERLVLALDRLLLAQKNTRPGADQQLNQLFKQAQSVPDFDPAAFAATLRQFAAALADRPVGN